MPRTTSRSTLLSSIALMTILTPLIAAAQASGGGQAPSPDEAGAIAASAVPQVVVSANRAPLNGDQVGQSVTVLTQTDIRLDQEPVVSDILARTPGVSFGRNGGPGETTSLYIRGAESAQTVVLIDGVKVNDPTDPGAGYDFANLTSGDIARIEVLRGPQSALYGSEAIGGVVNIVTADATKPVQGDLQVEGGSYGTAYVKGAVGGKEDQSDWRIGAYYSTTDSVSAFDRAFGGREADGYNSAGLTGRFRYDLTKDLQFDERVYYTASRVEFDGFDNPACNAFLATCGFGDDAEFSRTQQLVDYTGFNLSLWDGRLKNRLALEYNGLDRRNEDPQQADTKFTFLAEGRATTVEYEGSYAITPGYLAVFGAQNERSSINAQSPYYELNYGDLPTKAHVEETSGYGQLVGEVLPGLTLTGGGRYDAHSTFGDHVTGQASAAWKLNGGDTVVRASIGQGFKAPSLYQLYSEYGNTSLRPETAVGWDAGVEQRFLDGRLVMQATYFGRETKNLIDFVNCPGADPLCATHLTFFGVYDNVARAAAEGVELQGVFKPIDPLTLAANYTYDDVEDRSPGSPNRGLQLARRPKNTANASAAYVWPQKLRTEVAIRYAGDSFDDDAHLIRLKSYTLVDLRGSYPIANGLELYGRIENITDERYETTYQYGTLGRAAYGGVRVVF